MNDFQFYQVAIVILAGIMIWQGAKKYLKGEGGQTFVKFFFRFFVWGSMMAIALFPGFSSIIADFIGIEGNVNAVILVGFILIFLMFFKLLSAIERLEQQITTVTREFALNEIKEENDKKGK